MRSLRPGPGLTAVDSWTRSARAWHPHSGVNEGVLMRCNPNVSSRGGAAGRQRCSGRDIRGAAAAAGAAAGVGAWIKLCPRLSEQVAKLLGELGPLR